MGQIFTWDSVKEGRIPKLESFEYVSGLIRKVLADEPSVVSALLFGSVVRGDSNIRSDIDCAVVYDVAREGAALKALRRLSQTGWGVHVPVAFTCADSWLALSRMHNFGPAFLVHLRAASEAGGLIKGALTEEFFPTQSFRAEIEDWMRAKMATLQEQFAEMGIYSEERRAGLLKRVLEASMHVARKMLIYFDKLAGDSKKEVRAQYRAAMPLELSVQFEALLTLDAWYSDELCAQRRMLNEHRYAFCMQRLTEQAEQVLLFLRSNMLALDQTARP